MSKGWLFRAEDWWMGKASLLLGLVYLFSVRSRIPFTYFWLWALLSLVTIIGFASFGYLVNDYFDQEKDALVGKKNFLLGKSVLLKTLYCFIAALLLFSPWLFLPFDRITLALISIQMLAYLLYSAPPIRMKERGIMGLIMDALYAHAIPAVMASYTYMLIAKEKPGLVFLSLVFCWQFVVGIRNVLIHQMKDLQRDLQSETKTFLNERQSIMPGRILSFLKILELALLALLLGYLTIGNHLFLISLAVVVVSMVSYSNMEKTNDDRVYFPNMLYDLWLPYSFAIILAVGDLRFLLLLAVHALFFASAFLKKLYDRIPFWFYLDTIKELSVRVSVRFKAIINWTIYLGFRLFGIDLRKEKTDAMGYIQKRRNKRRV